MAFDVTASKPTYAQQYAAMEIERELSVRGSTEWERLRDLMAALKLGYLYGQAEGMREIADILIKGR